MTKPRDRDGDEAASARAGTRRLDRLRRLAGIVLIGGLALSTSCRSDVEDPPCAGLDPVLADAAFVMVTAPRPGARVASPFVVRGCSRTFESNVGWRLRGRDGRLLGSGHATGGGVDGAAPFEFSAAFSTDAAEPGHLEVYEPDASDGEGFPPGRVLIPLALDGGP